MLKLRRAAFSPSPKGFSAAFDEMRFKRLIVVLIVCFALVACSKRQPSPTLEVPHSAPIADIRDLPQDLQIYANRVGANKVLLDSKTQSRQNARFDDLFFSAWDQTKAQVSASEAFEIFGLKETSRPIGWDASLQHWTTQKWNSLVKNAHREKYPSRLAKAISVASAPLREAPTNQPRFGNPKSPGEGYPFDMFMYATLPPGMPLLVTHTSKDGKWYFVETPLLAGWVPVKDVALTDASFRTRYRNGHYAAILKDDVLLKDGQRVCIADVGALFPIDPRFHSALLIPFRDDLGKAILVSVAVNPNEAAAKPLKLTPKALAQIGNQMMGQAYGWGGLNGNRDCSQLMRDIFTPFGIWLPRNSAAQAKAWDYIPFGDRTSNEKDAFILKQGKAFATLLWLKGHITLYVGEFDNKPIIFHDMWGIRTEKNGEEGRHVVGQVVVTTTRPGIELPFVQDRSGLVNRMRGMGVLH